MSQKVLIIGIDSMDCKMVDRFIDFLPTIKKLKQLDLELNMQSSFPPDSDTAWASIYTGLCPAKHGVLNFVDPLEKSIKIHTEESDSKKIIGKTFWDHASHENKKVCVLFPHIAFPPWNTNGIMISRSRIGDKIECVPTMSEDCPLDELNTPKGVPKKDTASLIKLTDTYKKLVLTETEFFKRMILNREWDLFFCYSSTLDAIQHYFWDYSDGRQLEGHADSLSNVIKEFYILYDQMIKNLINSVNSDVAIIILSDHGHGSRPSKIININQIMFKRGLICNKSRNTLSNASSGLKYKSIEFISKYELGWVASKVLRYFPFIKKVYSTPSYIDLSNSLAYTTDLSGIKAYTYGGIIINKIALNSQNYHSVREEIISILNEEIGDYIDWIDIRENIYEGPYISKYPDILIQLKEGYGLGNKINAPILDKTYTSNIVPGSHNGKTPFIAIYSPKNIKKRNYIDLVDIAPTVIDLLDLKGLNLNFDGKSIYEGE